MEALKQQVEDILLPMYLALTEALKPAIEAYSPYHKELSKPILGPFSSYFVIIIVLQLLVNFWPCKLPFFLCAMESFQISNNTFYLDDDC